MVLQLDQLKNHTLNDTVESLLIPLLRLQRYKLALAPLLRSRLNHWLQLSFSVTIKQ
jgi:hypothetical protein